MKYFWDLAFDICYIPTPLCLENFLGRIGIVNGIGMTAPKTETETEIEIVRENEIRKRIYALQPILHSLLVLGCHL